MTPTDRYVRAVEVFLTSDPLSRTPYTPTNPLERECVDSLINGVVRRIRDAQHWEIPLTRTCYNKISLLDRLQQTNTPLRIEQASEEEKQIFCYVLGRVIHKFPSIQLGDLKRSTLLLSILEIHELATRWLPFCLTLQQPSCHGRMLREGPGDHEAVTEPILSRGGPVCDAADHVRCSVPTPQKPADSAEPRTAPPSPNTRTKRRRSPDGQPGTEGLTVGDTPQNKRTKTHEGSETDRGAMPLLPSLMPFLNNVLNHPEI